MTTVTYTPVSHQVWNEFDRQGLLLGLARLDLETNAEYKRRLLDVFVNRADSTYRGLINGITRELGLELYQAMTIVPVLKVDGTTLAANPAVAFKNTKCYLYLDADEENLEPDYTFDRFEETEDAWNYAELIASINGTGYFTATMMTGIDTSLRSMTIFDQSSMVTIPEESINKGGSIIYLENTNLIPGTFSLSSSNLTERVSAEVDLVKSYQYYVDFDRGVIYTTDVPAPGSRVRYRYRDDSFIVWASPVILHNLQSSDFQTKMFEQIAALDSGDDTSGAATPLGADILNELISVYGIGFGP